MERVDMVYGLRWPLLWGTVICFAGAVPTRAQSLIVPDQSLEGEPSVVIENVDGAPVELITGGAVRDRNLFHSFSEFNVDTGRVAFFIVPGSDAIANIFARVTGANASNIDGVLGAGLLGGALTDTNLFLINPNGIVFGETARLNLGGSFIATTASGLQFGALGAFSTVDPAAPSALLTVNPSAFLFSQTNPGAIASQAPLLSVFPGQSLLLVGGPITLDRSFLVAPGGDIGLVAVAEPGQVSFSFDSDRPGSLQVPADLDRSDIILVNGAGANAGNASGGSIALVGRNLGLSGNGLLITGVNGGTAENPLRGGDITLDAADTVTIDLNSAVFNVVTSSGVGRSGDINVTANNLTVARGSQISTPVLGKGQAGDVLVNVENQLSLTAPNPDSLSVSKISTGVLPGGEGSGGTLDIRAGSLQISGGAQISASNKGVGGTGTVRVSADETILSGVSPNRLFPSSILNRVEANAQGQGGTIELKTGSLLVTGGAQISASTFGKGDASTVLIEAGIARFADSTFRFANGRVVDIATGVSSSVELGAEGNAGTITLNTDILEVTGGAQILSGSFGKGNAGSVIITARDSATFSGLSPTGQIFSGAGSRVERFGQGQGGNVELTAGTLRVTQGAQITASTLGQGSAGDVTIQARDVTFSDSVKSLGVAFPAGVQSSVFRGAKGDGGNVKITAETLQVTGGAQVSAIVFGQGRAGSITIEAGQATFSGISPALRLGSGVFSSVDVGGEGSGGSIRIAGNSLEVSNGAQVVTSTFGKGDAGTVQIEVDNTLLAGVGANLGFTSGVFSTVELGAEGNGGSVSIAGNTLQVSGGAQVSASTAARGNGGDVAIAVSKAVFSDSIAGFTPSGARSSVFAGAVGNAGNLTVSVDSLALLGGAQFSTGVFGTGRAGTTTVVAKDSVVIDGEGPTGLPSGIFSTLENNALGAGGDILISAGSLTLTRGALVDTSTFSQGDAGDVVINLRDALRLDGFDPGGARTAIFSVSETNAAGDSGDIRITTGSLFATNGAQINAFTSGQGNAGDVIIEARDRIVFEGRGPRSLSGVLSTVEPTGTGSGGDIKISTGSLDLREGGLLAASSQGAGDAGGILIQARGALTAVNGDIRTSALSTSGGAIAISARSIRLFGDSDIRTSVEQGQQNGGNITLEAGAVVAFGDSDILAFARDGRGGDVTFKTAAFFGQNYQPQLSAVDPQALDGNSRVDINASGALAGIISVPDVSVVPNSLTELPAGLITPDQLLAGSCIAPAAAQSPPSQGAFVVTGSEGLPQRPGESAPSAFPTGAVATAPSPASSTTLVEPQGVYALADGRLVLSRACGS